MFCPFMSDKDNTVECSKRCALIAFVHATGEVRCSLNFITEDLSRLLKLKLLDQKQHQG